MCTTRQKVTIFATQITAAEVLSVLVNNKTNCFRVNCHVVNCYDSVIVIRVKLGTVDHLIYTQLCYLCCINRQDEANHGG